MLKEKGTSTILMAGLQGVGKTTACGKLAMYLKKEGKTVCHHRAHLPRVPSLGRARESPALRRE